MAGIAMSNPLGFLTRRLRNGENAGSGPSPSGGEQATLKAVETEGEATARQNETVWHVGEVYREIWDNEEDAVYDDLPAR